MIPRGKTTDPDPPTAPYPGEGDSELRKPSLKGFIYRATQGNNDTPYSICNSQSIQTAVAYIKYASDARRHLVWHQYQTMVQPQCTEWHGPQQRQCPPWKDTVEKQTDQQAVSFLNSGRHTKL